MSTRIKYTLNPDGSKTSVQVFKSQNNAGEYKCMISVDGKEGYVLNATDNSILLKTVSTSPHKTKIALKKALKNLSVVFLNEKRKST